MSEQQELQEIARRVLATLPAAVCRGDLVLALQRKLYGSACVPLTGPALELADSLQRGHRKTAPAQG